MPIPVAARFKASVCCHTLVYIAGLILPGETEYLSVVNVVCSQVEVSASG